MTPLAIEIPVDDGVTHALYYGDDARASEILLLLAHGAGAPQSHPFLVAYATALAARGIDVATFNFRYSDEGRRAPDRTPALESCWRAVLATLSAHPRARGRRIAIGGKSMGGRIATHLAADGAGAVLGVVLLGYPLHPPGQPEKLRTKHLPRITTPLLFVQGTRDAFGTPDELRPHLAKLPATLFVVDGGDHSFKVLKRNPLTQEQVHQAVQETIAEWLRALPH